MRILSIFWHSVERDSSSFRSTNPSESVFREHIRFVVKNYTPITIAEFLHIRDNERFIRSYKKPPVLLGFDDGFKNVLLYALPVLEEFKAPVLFFVIAEVLRNPDFVPWYVEIIHLLRKTLKRKLLYGHGSIDLKVPEEALKVKRLVSTSFRACTAEPDRQKLLGSLAKLLGVDRPKGTDLDDDLRFVEGRDLANLKSASLLTVASHAMSHRDLATLSTQEQATELETSDSLLREHCPSYYPVIAYPGGSFNGDTLRLVRRTYRAGFASFLGASYRNLYAYPRVGIGNNSVEELAYTVSTKRINYILPVKRLLHVTGIRPL